MMRVNMMEWMVTSSILILILLGVRALCANRISLRLRYALWLVAAMRLLVPFSFALPSHPMPITAANLAPATPAVLERPLSPETAGVKATIPPEGLEASGFHVEEDGGVTADSPRWYPVLNPETGTVEAHYGGWTLGDTLWALWAGGVGLTSLAFLGANLRFARQLKARRRPVKGAECPLPLYTVEGLASPCLFGLFRPAIYLTPGVEGEALEHVLAHELTHHAHKDHIWAVVRCLCLSLHWYNPLVWLAAILSKRDGELACDEGAVARLGEERRLSYGRTLVDLVAGERRAADLLTCSTTMTEGKSSIRRRVETLVKHPRTVKTALFALTAVVILAVVFTFAKEQGPLSYAEALDHLARANSLYTHHTELDVGEINVLTIDDQYAESLAELFSGGVEAEGEYAEEWLRVYPEGRSAFLTVNGPYKGYCLYLVEHPDGCYLSFGWRNDQPEHHLAILPSGTIQRMVELTKSAAAFAEGNAVPLTEDEVAWFNTEFFNGEGFNLRNQFLTSLFENRKDVDLYQLFYLEGGMDQEPISQEERAAVAAITGARDSALTRIIREDMDQILLAHIGMPLSETNGVGLEQFTYLEEYDAYYHWHGDTNYYPKVNIQSGARLGSMVYLYYTDEYLGRGACTILLMEMEEGYRFVAHRQRSYLAGFVSHLRDAEAICVFDPPISSHLSFAAPIRDGDLLAEAKELLTTVPLEGPVEEEFPKNAALSQALRLALTQSDGSMPPYYILGRAGVYYVGLMDIPTLGDFFPIAQLKKWDIYALSKLSREQFERNSQREEAGDHAAFLARLEEAQAIKMKQSGAFTTDSEGMIAGTDNLAQAKAMLRRTVALTAPVEEDFAPVWNKGYTLRLYPNINSEENTFRYYLFEGADGQWYLLNGSQQPIATLPDEIEASHLYALVEDGLPEQTKYEVTYPALREELKNLFLGDEETVTACTGNDPERVAEMEDWLTNWTSGYVIQYDVPWWSTGQTYTEPAWFARAVDAGSFYSINIPDHLVQPVLDVCREQEGYHQYLHDMYSAESMSFTSPAFPQKRIIPLHGAASLSELLMGEGMRTEQTITARLDIREADAVLNYTLDGQTLACYLQEVEEGCLISIVRGGRLVSAPIPVMGILPAGMSERLAALVEEMGEHDLPASTLDFMQELRAWTIFDFSLGHGAAVQKAEPDREALVSLIHRAAEQRVERDYDMFDHGIWSLDLYVVGPDGQPYLGTGDNQLTLSAGTEKDVVCFYYQYSNEEDGYYVFAKSPELHDLICGFYIKPMGAVVETDIAPLRDEVYRILDEELEHWNGTFVENGLEPRYTGVELTEFRQLASYPDLVKGRKVNLYAFDYGLTMADLEQAAWAGGNYADGKGRFHPYGMALHLLTVERPSGQKSKVESWRVIPWEYPLEVGQPDFEDTVDGEEVLSVVLNNLQSLLNPVIPADVTDPQQVAEEYGRALAQYYLSLGSGHPKAVTYAQLDKAEVYQQTEDGLCAFITLTVDPVEPNSVHWAAGAGIEQGEDGHWLHSLEYRLERREEDGAWMCTDRGTGGVSLPDFQWSASQSFEPDMERAMNWNTDLRAVATRLNGNGGTAMGVSGETGALMSLEVNASCLRFSPWFGAALTDTYVWGETLDALSQAGASLNGDEQPDPSPQARAAVSQWLRVNKDGKEIPGTLWWFHGNGSAHFQFDFDEPLSMKQGDQVILEIGPKD